MSCVSGLACVVGSSIICVDLIIQRIPGKRNFRIQDNNTFLSSSLSLSFGVMMFSSLYSMLPSAKNYLTKGGLSPQAAAYTIIGCFLGGVVGIQLLSRLMHHYIPSHVVDCQHSHEHDQRAEARNAMNAHDSKPSDHFQGHMAEQTPLLSKHDGKSLTSRLPRSMSAIGNEAPKHSAPARASPGTGRPSLQTRVSKLASGAKMLCERDGQCYGYSDPCAQECFKAKSRKGGTHSPTAAPSQPSLLRTATAPYSRSTEYHSDGFDEDDTYESNCSSATYTSDRSTSRHQHHDDRAHHQHASESLDPESNRKHTASPSSSSPHDSAEKQHHHHVHSNAFLSIGLQTSFAIALHKLPEGFITFATNHANPKLGFAVFMALFIHNITEGFAMALPLYLAIGSRWKSMVWSSFLGGVSQPFGAGVAAAWFKVAGTSDRAPGETVYGCMFAITAGIMSSVALQLFSESLALNHDRNLCLTFAFIGMGILGISFALTA
ncbi:MAG: hypothetical protein Q9224_000252 [Gallowayella concinna]